MMRVYLGKAAKILFVITWLLLFSYLVYDVMRTWDPFGPRDVSRRLTAPDGSRTALLERDYGFDLNFRLYVVSSASRNDLPDFSEAVWCSHDFDLATDYNWHEDLEWSADSSVIAVSIEGQYVFAYDFDRDEETDDPADIQNLLELRGGSQH